MPYTIWSHGRLVGETDLGFDYDSDGCRGGSFFPTEFGETLMAIIAEPRRLMAQIVRTGHRGPIDPAADTEWLAYEAATDREDALELQLRDPTGMVVPTEDIGIRDRQLLEELYPIDDPDFEELEFDDEPFDPALEAAVDYQLGSITEWQAESEDDEDIFGECDDESHTRYYVVVFLSDDSTTP